MDRNLLNLVPTRYLCPYCGECLAKFYTDDTYINVIIEDVSNEEASTKNIENTQSTYIKS